MQSMITMKSIFKNSGFGSMASITIRNLDDEVKARLRMAAAQHGRSMEEEARRILKAALESGNDEYGLGDRIREIWADVGGFELPERDESQHRPLPDIFDTDE